MSSRIVERCFTFTWMLENASYCLQKKGEVIESPAFVVDEIHNTKWKLWLSPRGDRNGNYIALYLQRKFDGSRENTVEIKYKLAFIGTSGSDLASSGLAHGSFSMNDGYGFSEFVKREDVFILKRVQFLQDDILRVRCKIYKSEECMTENVDCLARTRIGVEKRSFRWNLKNFSTFEPGKNCIYWIKSMENHMNFESKRNSIQWMKFEENDTKLMSVNLCLVGGQNYEEMIHFKLTLYDPKIKYCALRLSLIYDRNRRLECNHDEFWFDNLVNSHEFTFSLSRQKIIEKNLLFFGDYLSLQWEFVFSEGIISERIEEVERGVIIPKSSMLSLNNEKPLINLLD